jgi:hypothetical protein
MTAVDDAQKAGFGKNPPFPGGSALRRRRVRLKAHPPLRRSTRRAMLHKGSALWATVADLSIFALEL